MKRILVKFMPAIIASFLCASLTFMLFTPLLIMGCGGNLPTPSQDAIAINGAGAICAVVLLNDGDVTGSAQCTAISGQLATAINNFVPGSPTQNIVQLGNSLVAIIQADTNSKAADEIAIILGTILNIVSNYESADVVGIVAANAVHNAAAGRVQVNMTSAPRTKKQLYAAYNKALKAEPVTGLHQLK